MKSLELDGVRYKLSIWDTAGQERFRTLTSSYYRGAQGVILSGYLFRVDDSAKRRPLMFIVYDVSSRQTFDDLTKWFTEINTYCGESVVKMIIGNQIDKVCELSCQDKAPHLIPAGVLTAGDDGGGQDIC